MNFSSLIGMSLAVVVVYLTIFLQSANRLLFLEPVPIILVVGGTIATSLISFPLGTLKHLLRFTMLGFLFKVRRNDFLVATQILEVHFALKTMQIGPKTQIDPNFHPFLGEGLALLKRRKFSVAEMRSILDSRILLVKKVYQNDAKALMSIAKFPPAFGLLGACAGMISMSNSIKAGAEQIAPAMAVALVSSFWGIALANLVLLPLADFATKVSFEEVHTREMIADALVMIESNEPTHILFEKISGYLQFSDRQRFRDVFKDLALNSGEAGTGSGKSNVA